MEASHGVQTVLAVVERIEGGEAYDFSMALGRKYGIGSKEQNTGLIIVLATEDRAYYILTGRGLEGTLPDAICKRIENRQMLPYLREGEWDEAMLNTVRAITQYVDGDDSLVGSSDFDDDDDVAALIAFVVCMLLGLGLIFFGIWYDNYKKSYCPSCHQHKMKKISGYTTKNRLLGIRSHHDTYRCTHCLFTKEVHWDENINKYVALNFTMNLFNGMKTKEAVVQAKSNLRSTQIKKETAERGFRVQIESCANTLEDANSQIEIAKRQIDLAQKNYDLTNDSYKLGRETQLNLLAAENDLRVAKLGYMEAIVNWNKAYNALLQATGEY